MWHRECLDDARELPELSGDAVASAGEKGDLGACVLERTARLCAQLIGLGPGVRDHAGARRARTA